MVIRVHSWLEEVRVFQGVAEDLGEVLGADGGAGFFGEAVKVHEAAHVAGDHDVGVFGAEVFEFERAHRGGDIREGDGERAAETAALFAFADGDDARAGDGGEQLKGGFAAGRAAGVAGAVEGEGGFVFAGPGRDAEGVDDEIGEFPGA